MTLRIILGVLIVAVFAIAAIPLLVLLDLIDGGSGWGLCPSGLRACDDSYFTGPELLALLALALFVLLGLIRLCQLGLSRVEKPRTNATSDHPG